MTNSHGNDEDRIVFRVNDNIIHPVFGKGIILKKKKNGTFTALIVMFRDGNYNYRKTLNQEWVREHCEYESGNRKLLRSTFEEIKISDEHAFKYYQNKRYPLTDEMKKNLNLAISCFDPQISLIMIGTRVFIAVLPGEELTLKKMQEYVSRKCAAVFVRHPDFETSRVENKALLVIMAGNVFSAASMEEVGNMSDLAAGLTYREEIRNACDDEKIYGFAVGPESESSILTDS